MNHVWSRLAIAGGLGVLLFVFGTLLVMAEQSSTRSGRGPIVVGLPMPLEGDSGELIVEPNVQVNADAPAGDGLELPTGASPLPDASRRAVRRPVGPAWQQQPSAMVGPLPESKPMPVRLPPPRPAAGQAHLAPQPVDAWPSEPSQDEAALYNGNLRLEESISPGVTVPPDASPRLAEPASQSALLPSTAESPLESPGELRMQPTITEEPSEREPQLTLLGDNRFEPFTETLPAPDGEQAEEVPAEEDVRPLPEAHPGCCNCQNFRDCGSRTQHEMRGWGLFDQPSHHAANPAEEIGVGHERLPFAPNEIESSETLNCFRLRVDAAWGLHFPDRSEFYWAKPLPLGGKGPPLVERSVDFQDIRFQFENGGDKFSVTTEIPLRIVDPDINPNTAGLSEISVAPKTVIIDGETWQISQIFRTYFATGAAKKGLGTGHFSLEPGLLFRYKWSSETLLHSEVKFWFPLAGDIDQSGPVLRYSIGMSHVLFESDDFAVLNTLEFVAWSALDGRETPFPAGPPRDVDPVSILNVHPGIRCVFDNDSDLGLFELGISGAVALTAQQWYESLVRLDLRWSW